MISSNSSSKPLTMDQILTVLISRARVDAEESQRQLAGALNGLAALLWLAKQHPEAVAAYREVLSLSEASKGEVRLDNFQLLHTLHNLAELLAELARKQQQQQQQRDHGQLTSGDTEAQLYGPGVPRTLRDDKLASEAGAIRELYLAHRQAELATAHQAFAKSAQDALPAGLKKHRQHQAAGAAGSSHGVAAQGAFLEELTATGNDNAAAAADEDDGSEGDGSAGDVDAAAGGPVGEGWYIAVIDALKDTGADEEVAEAIREKLQESDTYQREVRR
jgi:E3 ubiquitin-protein ligase SHPRH